MHDDRPDWLTAVIDRLRTETGAALLLAGFALVALVWANSPWAASYEALWHTPLGIHLGDVGIELDLHHWVNDGLMVLFFFLIGLEVRQEIAVGSLRERRRALVPLLAGLTGVALPAVLYLAIAGREAPGGWGVVIGTDTAFLLGILALVGPAMSNQLRVFLLTLTVVDDFLAVAVIGVVYTENLSLVPLLVALVALALLALLGRSSMWRSGPYVLLVAVLWGATLASGVHPSLAGMAAGLLVPAAMTQRRHVEDAKALFKDYWQSPEARVARTVRAGLARSISVNERLHDVLRSPVSLVVVPIFALANAGVDLGGGALATALVSPITWGVVVGLVVGKLVGVSLGAWVSVRLGWGRLPQGVGPGSVLGGAALSGVGFTMALLIISLSLEGERADDATIGVLIALVLSTAIGALVFRLARVRWGETTADLPTTLTPEIDPDRDHVRGAPDAPVTVVEYLDFECPFCARTTGMWKDLYLHFGERIRYVARHLPLDESHPHARGAAVAAEAAGRQGLFWEMHDMLFAHQSHLEPEDLRRYAADLGLDLELFNADLRDPELLAVIERDERSAHASGAHGTPTFFLNGIRHRGPHDARTLIAALETPEAAAAARRRS